MDGRQWVSGLFVVVYVLGGLSLLKIIQHVQPKPYMDEIFHIPQAQQYCRHNFTSWDPMITTLPGLYLVTVAMVEPVARVLGLSTSELCSTLVLRFINVLFMCGNIIVLLQLVDKLHFSKQERGKSTLSIALTALTLASFPVLFFFTGLYYTDPGSVFFVLLMYLSAISCHHVTAATWAVLAIFFRQTNIVWIVMVTGLTASESLFHWVEITKKKEDGKDCDDWTVLSTFFNLIGRTLKHHPMKLFELFWEILVKTWSYILVGLGFGIFVFLNGGFVVGDRSHHQACLNFPQIFYFVSVTLFFSFSHLFKPYLIKDFVKFCYHSYLKVAVFLSLAYLAVSRFTYVHEYLLADNRHYPFYVWSKIFKRHECVKYVLIPVYFYGCWSVWKLLHHKNIFWKTAFFICLFAATVPQKLLEFRYFIIPYLVFRLNMKPSSTLCLLAEFSLYTIINIITVYLFVKKPFVWSNGEIQRFMW